MNKELELLEKIVVNTSSSLDPIWVAAITGGTAVLTALIAALVGYFTHKNTMLLEKEKLKVDIITKERMSWLKNLRENSSDYYVQMDLLYSLLKREIIEKEKTQKEIDLLSQSIMKKSNDLLLVLNTEDEKQNLLYNTINTTQLFIVSCIGIKTNEAKVLDDRKYKNMKNIYFKTMNDIGNETWKQIKYFE